MNRSDAHGRTSYIVSGSNITIDGGTFENTYPQSFYDRYGDQLDGDEFVSYNNTPEYYPSR